MLFSSSGMSITFHPLILKFTEVHDIVQETRIKIIPMEKKCKKAKWLSGEAFQIAVKEEK